MLLLKGLMPFAMIDLPSVQYFSQDILFLQVQPSMSSWRTLNLKWKEHSQISCRNPAPGENKLLTGQPALRDNGF